MSDAAEIALLKRMGKAVAEARRAQGMSQTQLADRVGVSRFTVLNLERGHRSVGAGTVLRVAQALGLFAGSPLHGALSDSPSPTVPKPFLNP